MSHYIGKTISLVSNKGLRYVGLLDNINADDSTVALKSVRLFGSEGRLAAQGTPHLEVLPGSDVYDYVVFRGSDVKDLAVLDTPIDQVKPETYARPPQPYFQPNMPQQTQAQQAAAVASDQPTKSGSQNAPAPTDAPSYNPEAPSQSTGTYASGPIAPTPTSASSSIPTQPTQQTPTPSRTNQDKPNPTRTDDIAQPQPQAQPENIKPQENPVAKQPQPGSRPQPKGVEIPQEHFDFESANAKFSKDLESEKELEHTAYDKKSSFFDNISSSTEQRSTMRWAEEKSLNMDTFGEESLSNSSRGRGRGRGRGGRGRGNWRGRGNGEWRGSSSGSGGGNGGRGNYNKSEGGYRNDPNSDYNTKPEWA